jgi:hypothetical protein
MPEVIERPVEFSPRITISDVVREFNKSIRRVAQLATVNYRQSYPQVDAIVLSNTTLPIWLPLEQYTVESIVIRCSSGTASATPRIDTVDMGVTGGVPISVTTTPTLYAITSANIADALSTVDMVVTGLGAGAWLTAALGVRRMN